MRILFIGHPQLHQVKGGDLIQYTETARALEKLGHEVEKIIATEFDESKHGRYEVYHWFNPQWTPVELMNAINNFARSNNIKIAMSPIYSDESESSWATSCLRVFYRNQNLGLKEKEEFYDAIAKKNLVLNHQADSKLIYSRYTNVYSNTRASSFRYYFNQADILLPNSLTEAQNLQHSLDLPNKPFKVVTNAVNVNVFEKDTEPFVPKEPFVLSVARVDDHKNFIMMAEAIKALGYTWIIVGSTPEQEYLDIIKRISSSKTMIVGKVDQHKLSSYYKAARVHLNASFSETCCLSALEAASIGNCNLVMGNRGSEISYYKEFAYYCDPLSLNSMVEAIRLAYENYELDQPRRDALKNIILTEYTWDNAAKQTIDAYNSIRK